MDKIEFKVSQEHIDYTFEQNPEIDHVLVTQDGNVFTPKATIFCKDHCARTNQQYKKVLRGTTVEQTEETKVIPLSELKKAELVVIAEDLGIEIPKKATNPQIIELIEKKREELALDKQEGEAAATGTEGQGTEGEGTEGEGTGTGATATGTEGTAEGSKEENK